MEEAKSYNALPSYRVRRGYLLALRKTVCRKKTLGLVFLTVLALIALHQSGVTEQDIFALDRKPRKESWTGRGVFSTSDSSAVGDTPRTHSYENRFIIYTRYRSGSTFAAQLLAQHPDIYTLFEPMKLVGTSKTSVNTTLAGELATSYLSRLLNCDFRWIFEELTSARRYVRRWSGNVLCFDPASKASSKKFRYYLPVPLVKNLEERCNANTYTAAKIIAVHNITYLFPLMRQGYKVIHLVRDPRGVLSSRIKVNEFSHRHKHKEKESMFVSENATANIRHVAAKTCQSTLSDLLTIRALEHQFNHSRYMLMRYEDLALDTLSQARRIYNFLNVTMHDDVVNWIEKSTVTPNSGKWTHSPFSTKRESNTTALDWKRHLPVELKSVIEEECADVMSSLGYVPLTNRAPDVHPLQSIAKHVLRYK